MALNCKLRRCGNIATVGSVGSRGSTLSDASSFPTKKSVCLQTTVGLLHMHTNTLHAGFAWIPYDLFVVSLSSRQRERFLRHSDTGPVTDWPSPDPAASPTETRAAQDGSASCARPRAWSVRTFQDFLPPLPQLHKKWCSWNSTSPFTKLVDSVSSLVIQQCCWIIVTPS